MFCGRGRGPWTLSPLGQGHAPKCPFGDMSFGLLLLLQVAHSFLTLAAARLSGAPDGGASAQNPSRSDGRATLRERKKCANLEQKRKPPERRLSINKLQLLGISRQRHCNEAAILLQSVEYVVDTTHRSDYKHNDLVAGVVSLGNKRFNIQGFVT